MAKYAELLQFVVEVLWGKDQGKTEYTPAKLLCLYNIKSEDSHEHFALVQPVNDNKRKVIQCTLLTASYYFEKQTQ
eukprot:10460479-Ditylum_brightwellii.AAC.1